MLEAVDKRTVLGWVVGVIVRDGGAEQTHEDHDDIEELGRTEGIAAMLKTIMTPGRKTVNETIDRKRMSDVVSRGVKAGFGGPETGAKSRDWGSIVDGKQSVINTKIAKRCPLISEG